MKNHDGDARNKELVEESQYRTRWDVRVRERNGLGSEDSTNKFAANENEGVPTTVLQPALGRADTIPGCSCQACRVVRSYDDN